jgi:hypothetical protein
MWRKIEYYLQEPEMVLRCLEDNYSIGTVGINKY